MELPRFGGHQGLGSMLVQGVSTMAETKPPYAPEFRAEAARLVKNSDKGRRARRVDDRRAPAVAAATAGLWHWSPRNRERRMLSPLGALLGRSPPGRRRNRVPETMPTSATISRSPAWVTPPLRRGCPPCPPVHQRHTPADEQRGHWLPAGRFHGAKGLIDEATAKNAFPWRG